MLKRIMCCFLAIMCMIVLFPVSAFAADPVAFSEAETLGAAIVDLYGAYNNTSLAYQNFSDGSALTEIVTLYNEYAQSASDPYALAAIGAAAAAAGAIAVIYDAVTGKGYIQLYQEEYVSSLDGFWDYTLNDLGFLRADDGHYYWLEGQPEVPVVTVSEFPLLPITAATTADVRSSGLLWYNPVGSSNRYFVSADSANVFIFLVRIAGYRLYAASPSTATAYRASNVSSRLDTYSISTKPTGYDFYCVSLGSSITTQDPSGFASEIPIFDDTSSAYAAFDDRVNRAFKIVVEPSVYVGDPLLNPESIEYPDPASPDYAPRPVTIQTNVEWDPNWGNAPVVDPTPGVPYPITDPATLNNLVSDLWSQIVANSVSVESPQSDPAPDDPSGGSPSEVFIPLLPVTLPDFHFSLSGIWHYVVTWVRSLGAWFTTMFTVWNSLPYAMVVPVYATAVIVIVLGVYRRFFM